MRLVHSAATLLLILSALGCEEGIAVVEDHRIPLETGVLVVPGDRWVRARIAISGEVAFDERTPRLAPPDPVGMTIFTGPMPESRRYGTQVEARYWVEATRLGSGRLAVIQRFDYGRYWIRTRSSYSLSERQAREVSRRALEEDLLPLALVRVRPLIAELARISAERE